MAEREIPGVVMDHKREWRQQKRDLDEGTKRGRDIETSFRIHSVPQKKNPGRVLIGRSTYLPILLTKYARGDDGHVHASAHTPSKYPLTTTQKMAT